MPDENWLKDREQVSPFDITVPDLPVLQRWPPVQQNFRRRETLPMWVSIPLIFLAIALIGGGLGLILFATTAQYRGVLHAQATAIALSTIQARSTAQAQDQATANAFATANTKIYASATAQSGATATATATVDSATATTAALGSVLTQATSGTAVLDDPLSNNNGNNKWDQTRGSVSGECVFNGTAYHVRAARQGFFQPCLAEASNFSNFAFQVSMTIDSGNQGGIVFRANSASQAFYLFYIDIDGRYSMDLYKSGSQATTLSSGYNAAIATGIKHSNQLAVVAYNGIFYLYANQQFITSLANSSLSAGKIGVVALDFKVPTEVEFTNAQVWNISSSSILTPTATQPSIPTATQTPATTSTAPSTMNNTP